MRLKNNHKMKYSNIAFAVENRFAFVKQDFGLGEYIQTVTVEGVFCHHTSSTMDGFKGGGGGGALCACVSKQE